MEEEKVEVKEEPKAEKELKISQSALAVCIALFSLFLIVLCSILRAFGVGSFTFYGIMSIVMYSLPLAGAIWSFIRHRKPSYEFWLNLAVFAVAILKF